MTFRLDYEKHKLYIFGSVPVLLGVLLLLNWWQTKDWVEYSITARNIGTLDAKALTFSSDTPPLYHNWGTIGNADGGSRLLAGGASYSLDCCLKLVRSLVLTWEANGQLLEVKMDVPPPSPEVFKRVRDHYGFQVNEHFFKNGLDLILEVDADHQRAWGYWQETWFGGPGYRVEDPREDEWWPARVLPLPVKPVREADPLEVDLYPSATPTDPTEEPAPPDHATDH